MASGSAPANGSPPASQSLLSTKSWTSASTNVNRCAGHLGVHTCCFRPEHASSTTISIKSSVAATPPSGDHRPPTLPPFCDGLVFRLAGSDPLPEHHCGGALTLANLCSEFVPLPVGAPNARRISGTMCRDPQGQHVYAAIGLAGRNIHRPRCRGAVMMPRHAVIVGSSLNRGDDLGGDAGVDIRAILRGHDQASPAQNRTPPTMTVATIHNSWSAVRYQL